MNTEYKRYIVKVGNAKVNEFDDVNEAVTYAVSVGGFVFDYYEFAIVFRA